MFSTDDTIVAIATPPGRGGLGVVRVSGPRASAVAAAILTRRAPLEPRRATLAVNKIDLAAAWSIELVRAIEDEALEISLLTGEGLDALRPALARTLEGEEPHRETASVTTSVTSRCSNARARRCRAPSRASPPRRARCLKNSCSWIAEGQKRARGAHRTPDGGRCAEAHLREVVHREVRERTSTV